MKQPTGHLPSGTTSCPEHGTEFVVVYPLTAASPRARWPHRVCRACNKAYQARSRRERPEVYRRYEQKRKRPADFNRRDVVRRYAGLSLEAFNEQLERQGGVCAICRRPERPERRSSLCVDHDHKTNRVRGILCDHCNNGLGRFGDDIERLRAAIRYLERS